MCEAAPESLAALDWYHTLELGGYTTAGVYDHRKAEAFYGVPADLRGKRVLDVGAGDGYFSFLFKRWAPKPLRSTRSAGIRKTPCPAAKRTASRERAGAPADKFRIARELLGLRAPQIKGNLYDLARGTTASSTSSSAAARGATSPTRCARSSGCGTCAPGSDRGDPGRPERRAGSPDGAVHRHRPRDTSGFRTTAACTTCSSRPASRGRTTARRSTSPASAARRTPSRTASSMPPYQPLTVAVVGCGNMVRVVHLPLILGMAVFRVVALCDTRPRSPRRPRRPGPAAVLHRLRPAGRARAG